MRGRACRHPSGRRGVAAPAANAGGRGGDLRAAAGLRILPILPLSAERIALLIGGLWFVNLVNFMDGIDWMTAAEIVPITAALAVIGCLGTPAAGWQSS